MMEACRNLDGFRQDEEDFASDPKVMQNVVAKNGRWLRNPMILNF